MAVAAVASVVTLGFAAPEPSTAEAQAIRAEVEAFAVATPPESPVRECVKLALVAVISAERLLRDGDRPQEADAQLRLARRYLAQAQQKLTATTGRGWASEIESAAFILPPPPDTHSRPGSALRTAQLGREVFSRL